MSPFFLINAIFLKYSNASQQHYFTDQIQIVLKFSSMKKKIFEASLCIKNLDAKSLIWFHISLLRISSKIKTDATKGKGTNHEFRAFYRILIFPWDCGQISRVQSAYTYWFSPVVYDCRNPLLSFIKQFFFENKCAPGLGSQWIPSMDYY